MNKPKLSTLLLSVGLIVSCVAAVNFFMARNQEMDKRMSVEHQLAQMMTLKKNLEKERDELVKTKEAIEAQLVDANTKAKQLEDQIVSEKRGRDSLTIELSKAKRESTDASNQLENERRDKAALNEELARAKQSYQSLSNELMVLRQAKEALEKRVKEMLSSQSADAEKIVVRPDAGAALGSSMLKPSPSLEGKVLVVNREFNFVVLNLGSKNGVREGTTFNLSRGDRMLGTAKVEKLYDNMSAATILSEDKKSKVQEGDEARSVSS